MQATIRVLASADAPAVAGLIVAAFEQYRGVLIPESGALRETGDGVAAELKSDAAGFVAEIDGAMAGCVLTRPMGPDLYLGRLSILPGARGLGLGRGLVEAVEADARRRGFGGALLKVRVALPGNQAFFERLGYVEIGREAHAGFDEMTTVIMRKPLAP
jgi:predicted N-acetyltransferase YhbS